MHVYLLASLPEFYVLVTALETNPEVPKMAVVVERLLHTERKMKEKENPLKDERAMTTKTPRRKVKCHHFGHYKRDCWDLVGKPREVSKEEKHKASFTLKKASDSESESEALVTGNALIARSSDCWIIDSGATSHMFNYKKLCRLSRT